MLPKKSEICLDGARRGHNQANSQFILTVREEDRRDKILEDVFMRSTAENPYHKRVEASIALCAAVAKEKQRQHVENSRNKIRRSADVDFRQMENKMRAAYVAKSVAAQNYENQQMQIEEKSKVLYENKLVKLGHLSNEDYNLYRDDIKRKSQAALKRDLQEQMAYTLAKRQRENESIMNDKRKMDEAVQKYRDEQLKNQQDAHQKKMNIKQQMDDFEEVQAKWREDHKNDFVEERQRYEEATQKREDGRIKYVQEQKRMRIQKILDHEEIGKKNRIVAEQGRKALDVLIELLIHERKAKDDMYETRDNEKKEFDRIKFRNEQIQLRQLKEHQKQEKKRYEEELYREDLRFLAERDAEQQQRDEEKLKETNDHRESLLNALSEKKRFKVTEMKRLIMADASLKQNVQRRARCIAKDRISFIEQHNAVKGFLHRDIARESNQPVN